LWASDAMQTDRRRAEELIIAEWVAAKLSGVARLADRDPPDAWIDDVPGEPDPIPLEIVRAYQYPEGQQPEPQRGAPAARAEVQRERQVDKLLREGAPGVISLIRDAQEAYAVPAVPGAIAHLPLEMGRLDPLRWLIEGVRRKCQMPYAPGTILAVDFRYPYPLDREDLAAVGAFVAEYGPAFRSVWICPWGKDAVLAPFPPPPRG